MPEDDRFLSATYIDTSDADAAAAYGNYNDHSDSVPDLHDMLRSFSGDSSSAVTDMDTNCESAALGPSDGDVDVDSEWNGEFGTVLESDSEHTPRMGILGTLFRFWFHLARLRTIRMQLLRCQWS